LNRQASNTISRHTYSALDAVGNRKQLDEVLPQLGTAGVIGGVLPGESSALDTVAAASIGPEDASYQDLLMAGLTSSPLAQAVNPPTAPVIQGTADSLVPGIHLELNHRWSWFSNRRDLSNAVERR
jgi:hypothetical protein